MPLDIPVEFEKRFTAAELRLALALQLFCDDKVTLGQGAKIAGLCQPEFMRELGKRRIPMHYDEDDLAADIALVREWQVRQ